MGYATIYVVRKEDVMPPVLLAEDDDAIRDVIHWMLDDLGYTTIIETTTGEDVLTFLRHAQECWIVILDIVMPKNGMLVIDALAQEMSLTHQHVIIVTTASRIAELPPAVQTIAASVLLKPFNLDDLLVLLDDAAQRLS
jgi:CheY-like chemotaxis protein